MKNARLSNSVVFSKWNVSIGQQHEPEPGSLFCPRCGSTDVRRSRSEGPLAFFHGLFGRLPFRCRSCRGKFYRHTPEHEHHEPEVDS